MFGVAKRVAGVRVLELDHRADVAGAERADRLARLAVEQVNLPDALVDLAVAVEQIHAGGDRAGIDAEERQFAEMRLGHRLEDVEPPVRGSSSATSTSLPLASTRLDLFAVHRRRAVFGDEIHQPRDADVVFRRRAEQRDEQFLLHRRVDAGAEFLLRQAALLEKLVHQARRRTRRCAR